MAKYKFVNEDKNNYLTFADLKCGDIFYTVNYKRITERILRMKVSNGIEDNTIDLMSGVICRIDDIYKRVKKYTGTLIFDEKDWTDEK